MTAAPTALPAETAAALTARVAAGRKDMLELLRALVAEQSVLGSEASAQVIVESELRRLGFATERVEVDADAARNDTRAGRPYLPYDGRTSVVGHLPGQGGGRSLHLSGHIDVVPVDHPELWQHEPWSGTLHGGRVYGRGAGDMKGGVAAYLLAAQAVTELCPERRGELIFSTVFEEECTGNGMWSVLRSGHVGDAVLVGEPTDLRLMRGATGVVWMRLVAGGDTGHSMLATGAGAFERLAQAVAALRTVEDEINTGPLDPDFAATRQRPYGMSVGRIGGGVWTASTPHELTAHVRFGFGPETSPAEIQARLRAAAKAAAPEVELHFEGFRAHAHKRPATGPLVDILGAAHRQTISTDLVPYVNTGTVDARFVETVPGYSYGPIAGNLHGTDEWVDLDSLLHTATVVALTAAAWTG